jgi:hypothetical protein
MTAEEQQKADAQKAADEEKKKSPGLITRAMQGIKDLNIFDALHPNGTGVTKRGYNDIYPPLGK